MTWRDALALGRVSNLPTVWTNLLAALVLAGGGLLDLRVPLLLLSVTLFYVGGMYLNDAFDAPFDARQRPERPIPAGRVSRALVFALGFGMLLLGFLVLIPTNAMMDPVDFAGTNNWPLLGGLLLAGCIVVYDWRHKNNPWSPAVMGACRFFVYVTVALAFAVPPPLTLFVAALMLLCYIVGLTHTARQESLDKVENLWPLLFLAAPLVYGLGLVAQRPHILLFWVAFAAVVGVALWLIRRRKPGDVPRAVVTLIAGISLYDALLIASTGALGLAVLAVLGFAATLALQRLVSGT